tara:strand:- start:267 stop:749 length:483 start_codon:yes stop_codon:yes gene_type:complete
MIKNILGDNFKYENDKMYKLNKHTKKWTCCNDLKSDKYGYIRVGINKKNYLLHRIIYKYFNEDWDISDISKNNQIDHININKSDNRIENLRILNSSQNNRNRNKFKNCSSKYIGVSWSKRDKKWVGTIRVCGKIKHIGYYDNEEEASEAYQKTYNIIMDI